MASQFHAWAHYLFSIFNSLSELNLPVQVNARYSVAHLSSPKHPKRADTLNNCWRKSTSNRNRNGRQRNKVSIDIYINKLVNWEKMWIRNDKTRESHDARSPQVFVKWQKLQYDKEKLNENSICTHTRESTFSSAQTDLVELPAFADERHISQLHSKVEWRNFAAFPYVTDITPPEGGCWQQN